MRKAIYLTLLPLLFNTPLAKTIEYVPGSSVLIGALETDKKCDGKEAQVFITKDDVVLYQIPVPHKGTFQAHLVPADYEVVSIDKGGCVFEKSLRVKKDQVISMDLKMEHIDSTKKNVSNFLKGLLVDQAHAMSMCVECLRPNFGHQVPSMGHQNMMAMRYGYRLPWWGNFGRYSFRQFQSPCPMGIMPYQGFVGTFMMAAGSMPAGGGFGSGCRGSNYPSNTPVMMGKPVVYFDGVKDTKIKVGLKYKEGGNLLATSPNITKEALNISLAGDGSFKHESAHYPYYFYDIRTEDDSLQDKVGRCVAKDELVYTMVGILKDLGFKKTEISDFSSYWAVRLPDFDKVCIYPQLNKDLDPVVSLDIKPTPASITRVNFVLVPIHGNIRPVGKFSKDPSIDWKTPVQRNVASKGSLSVREWGVSFLSVPQRKKKAPVVKLKSRKL